MASFDLLSIKQKRNQLVSCLSKCSGGLALLALLSGLLLTSGCNDLKSLSSFQKSNPSENHSQLNLYGDSSYDIFSKNFSLVNFRASNLTESATKNVRDGSTIALKSTANNSTASLIATFPNTAQSGEIDIMYATEGAQNLQVHVKNSGGQWVLKKQLSMYSTGVKTPKYVGVSLSNLSDYRYNGALEVKISSLKSSTSEVLHIDYLVLKAKGSVASTPPPPSVPQPSPTPEPAPTPTPERQPSSVPSGEAIFATDYQFINFYKTDMDSSFLRKANDGEAAAVEKSSRSADAHLQAKFNTSGISSGTVALTLYAQGSHLVKVQAQKTDGTWHEFHSRSFSSGSGSTALNFSISSLADFNYGQSLNVRIISSGATKNSILFIDHLALFPGESSSAPMPTPTPQPPAPTPSPKPGSENSGGAGQWIENHFRNGLKVTGDFKERTTVYTSSLVTNATGCCSKYAFDVKGDGDIGFKNVRITDLFETSAHGAGIRTTGAVNLFMSDVTIEPNWPVWDSYQTTNYDGIDFDGTGNVYAEDLTIKNWNADGGLDMKADGTTQFVRLNVSGKGHRAVRYWGKGPHYLVDSSINNNGQAGEGSLIWIYNCSNTSLYIYNSTFNGQSRVPANKITCDEGSSPNIIYLNQDPRSTGDLHPMFSK